MIRRPPRSTQSRSSAASDVYKRQSERCGAVRYLHTMIRVEDLDRSVDFYTNVLGLDVLRRRDVEEGRFTLVFLGIGRGTTGVQATAMLPWVSTMWPKRWNRFGAGAARSPGSQDNLREAGRSWLLSRIRTGIRLSSWSPAIDCGCYVGLRGEVGAIVGREYQHLCLCKRRAHV